MRQSQGRDPIRRVVVAMSGGVDSSVAAAVLKDRGYEVIGITMQIWPMGQDPLTGGCCSLSAVEDARRVAAKIGIRHYVLNFREAFARKVIDYFIQEYRRGHTPNPCIRCNQFIKFDLLLHRARELEAEYVATGHYARICFDPGRNRWLLLRGLDPWKDQSYALYSMTQDQLAHTLFPLGELRKEETRSIARTLGLEVAEKPESQEICFVSGDYREFLREAAPDLVKPGPLLDVNEKEIGRHQGIAFYTIGQRKGLGISAGEPRYVVRIDPKRNAVVVGAERDLYRRRFVAKDVNWISIPGLGQAAASGDPSEAAEVAASAAIRYNMPDQPGRLRAFNPDGRFAPGTDEAEPSEWIEFEFDEPQRAITPGQAAVFYRGEEVLGGGTIADDWEIAERGHTERLTVAAPG